MIPLFKKKYITLPTLYGWILILLLLFVSSILSLKAVYPFLSRSIKPNSKILVVEGWIPDSGIKNAIRCYRENGYQQMIVTGVPITQWTFSSPFSNMAEATKETMRQNFFRDSILIASIPNTVLRDRTYATAVALKMEAEKSALSLDSFDLYSMGAHARRSHLMFSKVFPDSKIGLIVDTDPSFDSDTWYKTSRGFRIVFSELVSYFYSRLFFWPNQNLFIKNIIEGKYIDQITTARFAKDRYFADSTSSPLKKTEIFAFKGLNYFDINLRYKFHSTLSVDTSEAPFHMPTSTERLPLYRKYGVISFSINEMDYTLTAYQNMDILEKNPEYRSLFIPFKDLTNPVETYGGGRYLDIEIPENDSVILDFNNAYNPYCAYNERWSCPLPPFENHLKVRIEAGEKNYKTSFEHE